MPSQAPAPTALKEDLPGEERLIVDSLVSTFGEKVKLVYGRKNRVKFLVTNPQDMVQVSRFLRDNLHFDHCTNVTGTDFPKDNQIQIDYQFGAIGEENLRRIIFTLSTRVQYTSLSLPSLIDEYPSVELHERETFEMLGVSFEGHPDLSRLLLPEDWADIPPMLKKYRLPGRLEGE